MTSETMGLQTNHDNQRQKPFEHKLDIKERTQTPQTTHTQVLSVIEVVFGLLVVIIHSQHLLILVTV